ncbi:DUF6262 family protein [Paenibacillus dauci]|uniref:DUF6262 family protein n=1 Tax=Paenibacillus dauci TaxID=1567106 RepID=UPI0006194591|nr:DUF6262 family protein [Paenibacillus dauci]
MANAYPNRSGLQQHAIQKREHAIASSWTAIQQLQQAGLNINFNTVSSHAKVSKAFLYGYGPLRSKIEELRLQKPSNGRIQVLSDSSKDVVIESLQQRVASLTIQINELQHENKALQQRLQMDLKQSYEQL